MKDKEQLLSLIESEIKAELSQGERLDLAKLLRQILNLIIPQGGALFIKEEFLRE